MTADPALEAKFTTFTTYTTCITVGANSPFYCVSKASYFASSF